MQKTLLLCLSLLLFLFPALGQAQSDGNLLINGGFDHLEANGSPTGWYTDAWFTTEGYTVYGTAEGMDGGTAVSIHNLGSNDARYAQTVSVEPSSLYRLSGYILAEDIPDAGWGANLSIEGLYASTEGLFDTRGKWQYVTLYGETGSDQREVTVFVRLGGYSGESEGMAYFDDIRLEKITAVPSDSIAVKWYRQIAAADAQVESMEDEDEASNPFWPYLLVLSAGYLLLLFVFAGYLCQPRKSNDLNRPETGPYVVIFALIASLVLHYWLSLRISGYPVDINCFLAWSGTMQTYGPTGFYQGTSFCDYPPAYMLVLWLSRGLITLLRSMCGGVLPGWISEIAIIKLVPCLCDLGIAWLIYHTARKNGMEETPSGLIALFLAFNPVMLINSAAWGQVDSALAIMLVLVALFAIKGQWDLVMPAYMLAVLIKPQALMLGILGLTAIILSWIRGDRQVRRRMMFGVLYALGVAVLIILPFGIHQRPGWLLQRYTDTLSSYAYVTVNTANLYYLFGYNWTGINSACALVPAVILAFISLGWGLANLHILHRHEKKLFFVEPAISAIFAVFFLLCGFAGWSWSILGYGAIAWCVIVTTLLYLRGGEIRNLPFLGALLFLLLYVLGIKMHERYLFPAIAFLFLAFVIRPDRRILILFGITSVTMFVNEGIVLDNALRLGSALGHLNSDTVWLANILSILNLLCIPLSLWTAADLCLADAADNLSLPFHIPVRYFDASKKNVLTFHPDVSLHWKRVDTILVLGVTLLYSFLALFHLGSHKAPEHPWTSSGAEETVILDLGEIHDDFSFLYYCQVSYQNFAIATSDDGEVWSDTYWAEMDQGQCFRWKYLMPSYGSDGNITFGGGNSYRSVQKLSGRYVRITAKQIGLKLCEVILRSSVYGTKEDGSMSVTSGTQIPYVISSWSGANADSPLYCSPEALCDEQDSLEGEPTWYTGTYFDEIYHARTAFEHLHGTTPYETTHPPLGKVMMSWFVGIFGMNPFGWRFAGALAGILMLPVIYLLAKQLTKKTAYAFAAMVMLALDCMHYTQTRIATIDSFPVLFILCAYFFMLRFMQRDLTQVPMKKLLPDLALSGFFMGCAVSSKWIGIYAGIGLAILYFWTLFRHLRMRQESRQILNAQPEHPDAVMLTARAERAVPICRNLCLFCLIFFVMVPLCIYLASYVPYFAYQHPQSLSDFLKMVWKAQEGMLSYHSTPGLGMDHPFYSPWYEWPIIARPMYYAMGYFTTPGQSFSIFCFGNPAVWWVGILGVFCVLCCYVYRHFYARDDLRGYFHLDAASWSINPAFLLISLLAQFLPWVLVPRGTYIYHYFASVPFLILANTLSLKWLGEKWEKAGRITLIVYLCVCLAFFVLLFPYASGMTVSYDWLDLGKMFLRIYYALPT